MDLNHLEIDQFLRAIRKDLLHVEAGGNDIGMKFCVVSKLVLTALQVRPVRTREAQ